MTDEEGAVTGTSDVVTDDDALYVLTAVLLTPAQFPSVLGDDYPAACAAFALEPYAEGYGLVLGQDGGGARWTVVVEDVSLVAVAIAAWDCGMDYDLSPDDRSVVCALPGWPLAVRAAAPGLAAPHDPLPDPDADGTDPAPLTPPDTESWGPAQRRMGADEIAHQWAAWREQLDDETDFATPGGGAESAGARPTTAPARPPGLPNRSTPMPEMKATASSVPTPEQMSTPTPTPKPGMKSRAGPEPRWSPRTELSAGATP